MTSLRTALSFVLAATVLAVLALRFWPARQEEEPPWAQLPAVAIAPASEDDEQESFTPVPDQGVQHAIVLADEGTAGAEYGPTASDAEVVVSWRDEYLQLGLDELRALDRTIRTPRPFVPRCLTLPPEAFACRDDWTLLTEEEDPEWSRAMEQQLAAIWNRNVTGISSQYLFVMCKTTLCQVNYRFPPGIDDAGRNGPFGQFLRAFRASDLTSELQWACATYSGSVVAVEFERTSLQSGSQPPQRTRPQCRTMRPIDRQGP